MSKTPDIEKFDQFFKESFEHFEPTPPTQVWNGVQSSVAKAKLYSAIAKVVAVVVPASSVITYVVLTSGSGDQANQPQLNQPQEQVITTPDLTTEKQVDTVLGSSQDIASTSSSNTSSQDSRNLSSSPNSKNNSSQTTQVSTPQNATHANSEHLTTQDIVPANPNTSGQSASSNHEQTSKTQTALKSLFKLNKSTLCAGEALATTNLSSPGCEQYLWQIGSETIKTSVVSEQPYFVFEKPGTYQVKLSVSKDGQTISTQQLVNVSAVSAQFSYTQKGNVIIFNNQSSGADQYHWDFGDGSSPSTSTNPEHSFFLNSTQSYRVLLKASNQEGCSATQEQTITIKNTIVTSEPTIPNVFSPDGDRINDEFVILIKNEAYYHLVVMDGQRNVVFESKDQQIRWNGNHQKQQTKSPNGLYYYTFKYRIEGQDTIQVKNGTIKLIRP